MTASHPKMWQSVRVRGDGRLILMKTLWLMIYSGIGSWGICIMMFRICKLKVKCTLVQAPRLCTGRTAHRGSRGVALPLLDHDTRRGWGVSVTPRPLFTPGKDPVPILQEAGWAPGPVWTGAENLAPARIRSQDRPARSQSLSEFVHFTK
jgi:hypothetical protein